MFNVHIVDESKPTLWVIAHSDVVPPGDLDAWGKYQPYEPVEEGDKIIGRGVKDNGHQLVSALYGISLAARMNWLPDNYNVRMLVVGDEEVGNKYGMDAIIDQLPFKKDDLYIIPDAGNKDGSQLEVAEKHIRWYKFTVHGKQKHASLPSEGVNATLAAANLMIELDKSLHGIYDAKDTLYVPETTSTFAITKSEENVENPNTIPGKHIFYMDARVLPEYDMKDVHTDVMHTVETIEDKFNVKIDVGFDLDSTAAPNTDPNAPVVKLLGDAVKTVYPDIEPRAEGIGGGTFCNVLRLRGYQVVGWGHGPETDHAPKEYIFVDNLVNDAKVYATIMHSLKGACA